jgi:hypothetical protein
VQITPAEYKDQIIELRCLLFKLGPGGSLKRPLSALLSERYMFQISAIISDLACCIDRLCGLVVRVPGYRSRGPGSIPGATGSSEKLWVRNRDPLSLVEYN